MTSFLRRPKHSLKLLLNCCLFFLFLSFHGHITRNLSLYFVMNLLNYFNASSTSSTLGPSCVYMTSNFQKISISDPELKVVIQIVLEAYAVIVWQSWFIRHFQQSLIQLSYEVRRIWILVFWFYSVLQIWKNDPLQLKYWVISNNFLNSPFDWLSIF